MLLSSPSNYIEEETEGLRLDGVGKVKLFFLDIYFAYVDVK